MDHLESFSDACRTQKVDPWHRFGAVKFVAPNSDSQTRRCMITVVRSKMSLEVAELAMWLLRWAWSCFCDLRLVVSEACRTQKVSSWITLAVWKAAEPNSFWRKRRCDLTDRSWAGNPMFGESHFGTKSGHRQMAPSRTEKGDLKFCLFHT